MTKLLIQLLQFNQKNIFNYKAVGIIFELPNLKYFK